MNRPASLLRRLWLAWAFLTIPASGPDIARAMQEQPRPGCVIVSPAEPDEAPYAGEIPRSIARAATGIDVGGLADAWRRRPAFAVRYESDDRTLSVSVEEIQDSLRTPATWPIRLALEAGALGVAERFDVTLQAPSESFDLPFPHRPRFVAVRPAEPRPMRIQIDQPPSAWVAQLRHASFPEARLAAAEALQELPPDPALVIGLQAALSEEPDSRVRAAVARAIARLASGGTADRALAAAYEDLSPDVRKAVLASLGQALGEDEARPALAALALRAAQSDPDPSVQAEAVRALAVLRAPEALLVARSALITPSPNEIIRIAGLDALGMLHAYVHSDASGEDAKDDPAAGEAEPEGASDEAAAPEIPDEALEEGVRFADRAYPLPLRSAARRLFLRIRRYEPMAAYGAPDHLHDLQPCP